jgi:prepilin-type N-terminal cleavage/methylation domain-containing protein
MNQRGFTLIELLVAMAVFSFMLLIIVVGFMNIVNVHNAALASNHAQDSARAAMDEMVQGVRDSTGVQWIHQYPAYAGLMDPGVANDSNFDVFCLSSASGNAQEYFVAWVAALSTHQLFVRNTGNCSTAALNPTDTALTANNMDVRYFDVKQVPDPTVTGLPAGWKPQVEMTLKLGTNNGTASGNGVNFKCNANVADRAFCATATITSGAAPR